MVPNEDKILKLIVRLRSMGDGGGKNSFLRREEIMNRLVTMGPEAVPHLIPMLKDENISVREHVARALGYIGDASALPALIDAVEDVYIRGASIRALEGIGEASIPVLIELAANTEESISGPALSVLSMLGERSLPALKDILMDGEADPSKREVAGRAMSVIRMDRRCPFGGSRTMGKDCKYCDRKHKE